MHLSLSIRLPASYSQGAFNPLTLAPSLWLDSADATTLYDAPVGGALVAPSGGVARWEDKSGFNNHATQATAGLRPTRVVGAGVDFNNLNQGMQTSLYVENPMTIVLVGSQKTGGLRMIQALDEDSLISGVRNSNCVYVGNEVRSAPLAVADEIFIITLSCALGQTFQLYKNSDVVSSFPVPSTDWGTISLGFSGGYPEPANGSIRELLAFRRSLSVPERLSLEAHLKAKWGVI